MICCSPSSQCAQNATKQIQSSFEKMDTSNGLNRTYNRVKLFSIFLHFRESRRKTPTAVCLKENERLFGDGALGVVRHSV